MAALVGVDSCSAMLGCRGGGGTQKCRLGGWLSWLSGCTLLWYILDGPPVALECLASLSDGPSDGWACWLALHTCSSVTYASRLSSRSTPSAHSPSEALVQWSHAAYMLVATRYPTIDDAKAVV